MKGFDLSKADPTSKDARELIEELDVYQLTLYPVEVCHRTSPETLLENGVFYLASLDGDIVGCGGLLNLSAGEMELKRMFVRPFARGKGVAKKILASLESQALQQGVETIFLETGPPQKEAVAFYKSAGYQRRGPYGGYEDHPLSIFMEKRLSSELSQSNGSAS